MSSQDALPPTTTSAPARQVKPSSRHRYEEFRRRLRDGAAPSTAPPQGGIAVEAIDGAPLARRRYLTHYVSWLWPYRWSVAAIVVTSLLVAGTEMVQPLFVRHIIDKILIAGDQDSAERWASLHRVGILFLALIGVQQALSAFRNYRQRQLNVRVILSLRKALFERLIRLPLNKLADMKIGGILSRLSGDVDTTTGLLQMGLISPGVSLVRLLIAIGVLFWLNWQLAMTAIALIPIVVFLSFNVARRVRPIYRAMRKDSAEVDARVSETFSGIRVVRAFQREVRELADFLLGRHAIVRKELYAHRRELGLSTTWGFILAGVNVIVMWFGGYLVLRDLGQPGGTTIGDLVAFQNYTLLLLNPVWQMVNSFSELQRSLAAMERVFEVLDTPEDKPDRPHAQEAPKRVQEIQFEHVWFSYEEDRPVIRDFDITVPGGSIVALVGRSGAGKTTITDLVARFQDPTRGGILLNGVDIRDMRLQSYRGLIGIVQQEVFLFDGTVAENIAYGRRHASRDEIIDAARRANAHEFVRRLPLGYDEIVGERGIKLSGGQCQRLSIARAILADPQILILDEATSNLDTESEQLIQKSLSELLRGRTTFVIAHRLSTITSASVILVMHRGQIRERGTHDELMAAEGEYYRMVLRQRLAEQTPAE
ncbi:MAG TPA: ABC transporter ATP-binding protein [Pirellulaceae bacterium]